MLRSDGESQPGGLHQRDRKLTRGAGSLHQFSLYEYAHITAGIVGEDGN